MSRSLTYQLYFYGYWGSFALEAVVGVMLVFSLFNSAMAPLAGIKQLGRLVFRWTAAISIAVTLTLVPHSSEHGSITRLVIELQRMQGTLTLCLLLFVFFTVRPLGLSYRSRVFGVSLGLAILAATNLVTSSWLNHFTKLYSSINIVNSFATFLGLTVWIAYFALPESKRRIVVLPTTSPFLRWNQIAQALGDSPGFVAIGGVPPELFAPAELEVMRRASLQMRSQPVASLSRSQTA